MINLSKGQKVSLDSGIKFAKAGLGWDVNSFDNGSEFDLDASVFMLGPGDKLQKDEDFIFYNNQKHASGAVTHSGDNRTGAGEGDDESIYIDFTKVPSNIEKLAFVKCHYETLHIPYTCHLFDLPAEEWPVFGREDNQGCEVIWDRPYAEQDLIAESEYVADDDHVVDEYGVVYTKNMKRLLYSRSLCDSPTTPIVHMTDYTVPDGVETICSQSFIICKEHLTLHLPHSIKVIGDNLFGEEGGEILFK